MHEFLPVGRVTLAQWRRIGGVKMALGRWCGIALVAVLVGSWTSAVPAEESLTPAGSHFERMNESRSVKDRVDDLRARFRVPATGPLEPMSRLMRATRASTTMRPALAADVATGFELLDGTLRALLPRYAERGVVWKARVVLPERASGPVQLSDETSRLALSFSLREAGDVTVATAGGMAMYAGALAGADLLHRVHAEGTEDYVVFEQRPAREQIAYDVDVSRVAGLRLVGNTLEFLDDAGAPRLRVAAPWVVDATGGRAEAVLAVDGCSFDSSPRAPFDRPVTAPGASHCLVQVSWKIDSYPAMVDPSWTATGSMVQARWLHTATRLDSGKVLIAGGHDAGALASAELYDPSTRTFAATDSLAQARWLHSATRLDSGKVLIAGGWIGGIIVVPYAELYDEATGKFVPTGSMTTPRLKHTATLLDSGKVLIAGGDSSFSHGMDNVTCTESAELYDPVAGKFTVTGSLAATRGEHTATRLDSGKVLIAGGIVTAFPVPDPTSSAELYDPASETFSPTGEMANARVDLTATLLPSGGVLVAGGWVNVDFDVTSNAEVYDPTQGTFSVTGSMTTARTFGRATLLDSDNVLITGGWTASTGIATASAELYDPEARTFSAAVPMTAPRGAHSSTLLASGDVLIAGGSATRDSVGVMWLAEVFGNGTADGGEDASTGDGGTDASSDAGTKPAPAVPSSGCSCRAAEPRNAPSSVLVWLGALGLVALRRLGRGGRQPGHRDARPIAAAMTLLALVFGITKCSSSDEAPATAHPTDDAGDDSSADASDSCPNPNGPFDASATQLELPHPTGTYAIGTQVREFVDPSRTDPQAPDPSTKRTLMIQLYYPTDACAQGPVPAYLSPWEAIWFSNSVPAMGAPKTLSSDWQNQVLPHGRDSIPMASDGAKFPVVLFSHGLGFVSGLYAALIEDLVSNGFVVVAISHTYDAGVVVSRDGSPAFANMSWLPSGPAVAVNAALDAHVSVWVADARFVLDQITGLDQNDPENLLTGRLDLDRVGMFGHSYGGATAGEVCALDPRFKAGVDLDGSLVSPVRLDGGRAIPVPFMMQLSEQHGLSTDDSLQNAFSQLGDAGYAVELEGAQHLTFSDAERVIDFFLGPSTAPAMLGTIEPVRALSIIDAYTLAFFRKSLEGTTEPLLDGPTPYPEVIFVQH